LNGQIVHVDVSRNRGVSVDLFSPHDFGEFRIRQVKARLELGRTSQIRVREPVRFIADLRGNATRQEAEAIVDRLMRGQPLG